MSALLSVEKVTWRGVLGTILGWVVRLWVRTLFVVIEGEPPSRGVSAFLHGQQMALLSARRPTGAAVLVSRSRDGEIQAAAMSVLGFRVVRGSSTKGGARGLVRLLRLARAGFEVALAVDGPRGPVSVPKPGAGLLAARAKVPLIAVASASRRRDRPPPFLGFFRDSIAVLACCRRIRDACSGGTGSRRARRARVGSGFGAGAGRATGCRSWQGVRNGKRRTTMSKRIAMIDGVVHPLERATVSVLDRGFLYGDAVFETIRTYGGHLHALDEHLDRLERSTALVYIELPVSRGMLAEEIDRAVREAGNEESYVRVMITPRIGRAGARSRARGAGPSRDPGDAARAADAGTLRIWNFRDHARDPSCRGRHAGGRRENRELPRERARHS